MNKDRRKDIDAVMADIEKLKALHEAAIEALKVFTDAANTAAERVEELKDEEQEYFDNMPESMQGGDKGQAAEAAISQMETALDTLREYEALELESIDIDSIITALDEAKQD